MRERAAQVVDLLAAIAAVAGVMMLVRPGSQGPLLVEQIGQAFIASVHGAVGFYAGTGAQPAPKAPKGAGSSTKPGGSSSSGGGGVDIPWWLGPQLPGIGNPFSSDGGPLRWF